MLTVVEVKLVEVHPFHQVTQRFGFKRGQSRVTDSPAMDIDDKGLNLEVVLSRAIIER